MSASRLSAARLVEEILQQGCDVRVDPRWERHGKLIDLSDALWTRPGAIGERRRLLAEIEQDLPGFHASLLKVSELEEVYVDTGNGSAALRALLVSQAAGWPCPPRWVTDYLARAAQDALAGDNVPDHLARAFQLREGGGGHGPIRRLETRLRQRHAAAMVCEVLLRLEQMSAEDAVPDRRALVEWYASLPVSVRESRARDSNVLHAARIVAHEIGQVSPTTVRKWFLKERVVDEHGNIGIDGPLYRTRTP